MSNSFKIVIIGGQGSGKTSLVKKINHSNFDANEESTVGVKA